MTESMTLVEFQKQFLNEDDCLDYLEKMRWPAGFRCPNCTHDVGYKLEFRQLIQCAVCRHQTSLTSGTVFHKTRTPLVHWFWMIRMMADDKGGASVLRMAKELGMHYNTAWHIAHKIREAMNSRDREITLAGFIELDEAIIGPHARKPGRPRTNANEVNGEKPLGKSVDWEDFLNPEYAERRKPKYS